MTGRAGSAPRRRAPARRKSSNARIWLDDVIATAERGVALTETEIRSEAISDLFTKCMGLAGGDRTVSYTQGTHNSILAALAIVWTDSGIHEAVFLALIDRIEALEAKVAQQRSLAYLGAHKAGDEYEAGSIVTHQGSMWHANEATAESPGEGSRAWTLCVKRGRDGRDLR